MTVSVLFISVFLNFYLVLLEEI